MARFALSAFLLTTTAATLVMAETQFEAGKQLANSYSFEANGEKQSVPFYLYVPRDYDTHAASFPLLLFLHGLGESGDGGEELERVTIHGPCKRIKNGDHFPFIVVAPQCRLPEMSDVASAWQPELLLSLLDQLESVLRVDKQRIYVTGLSMGGYGTWRLAAAAPDRFAAAVPICGGGEPEWAAALSKLPIWAFHGKKDSAVPLAESKQMIEWIKDTGGHPQLTIYPEADHDSWTATYDNQAVYDWLLSHRRSEPPEKE